MASTVFSSIISQRAQVAVFSMNISVVKYWRWKILTRRCRYNGLIVFPQEKIDGSDNLPDNFAENFVSSDVFLFPRIPLAFERHQTLVGRTPLSVVADCPPANKIQDLFQRSRPFLRELHRVFAGSCLVPDWCPSEQRSELRGAFNVADAADGGNYCACRSGADASQREQNPPFSRRFDDLCDFVVKIGEILEQEPEFNDELLLLKAQCLDASWCFNTNAVPRCFLKLDQIRIAWPSRCAASPQLVECCMCKCLRRWKSFADDEGCGAIGVFDDFSEFREQLIADSDQFILSAYTLLVRLVATPDQRAQRLRCLREKSYLLYLLLSIVWIDTKYTLIIQRVGKRLSIEPIIFVMFHALLLDMDFIDSDADFLEILYQGMMIVSCFLQEYRAVFEWCVAQQCILELFKTLPGVVKLPCGALLIPLVLSQQGITNKRCDMIALRYINALRKVFPVA
jgi:hypothetical protein